MVGVLIFVDQYVAKLLLVNGGDIWKRSEEVNRFADQIVEVESIVAAKLALILQKQFGYRSSLRVAGVDVSRVTLCIAQLVLRVRDCGGNSGRSQSVYVCARVFD